MKLKVIFAMCMMAVAATVNAVTAAETTTTATTTTTTTTAPNIIPPSNEPASKSATKQESVPENLGYTNRMNVGINIEPSRYVYRNVVALTSVVKLNYTAPRHTWKTGIALFGGYRWDSLGLQIGYVFIPTKNYTGPVESAPDTTLGTVSVREKGFNFYVDGLYYYALNDTIDLKALLGFGILQTKQRTAINGSLYAGAYYTKTTATGARIGGGLQSKFTDSLSGDLMFKYQTHGNKVFKHIAIIALGLTYYLH